jgi:sulfur-oxidizing protein SoxY
MDISRRQVLKLSASAAVLFAASGYAGLAHASAEEAAALISEFTNGTEPSAGRITLTLPETAENGNSVALSVQVESAMEGDDLVESVIIVADGNPRPHVAQFHFTELSGIAAATTRIRLAQSQSITAIAKMRDGSLYIDRREVQVLVGGCTG